MAKPVVTLDRPIFLGFSILELSKMHMYSFHYKHMAAKYGRNALLVFSDTDSFIYWIRTDDLYKDLAEDEGYDFSNYPRDHPLYSTKHKKQPGYMKDESAGAILENFVGLRSKMYSIHHEQQHTDKDAQKAKGIKRATIRTIKHEDYIDCLFQMKQMQHSFHAIRSQHHQLYTVKQKKQSLSCYDDKRYLLNCSIHSLPYGHKALKRKCEENETGVKYQKCKECSKWRRKQTVRSVEGALL